jgi:hypothetical protein
MTNYYKVAGHIFSVSGEAEVFTLMMNYVPFGCEAGTAVFMLTFTEGKTFSYTEELRQDDEDQQIICGRTSDGKSVFEFVWLGESAGWLVCEEDCLKGCLILTGRHTKMAIDNALMVLFALSTADKATALFHASMVSHDGKGYMFLGKSGTGKSTHARLWLQNIEGSELVNDDNPVVRIYSENGAATAVVYGSPWSGKTPCYRNVSYPLGGIVLLSQAPYNKIHRICGLKAYASLVSSISGKRWDSRIADGLHHTENELASTVPIWYLECLPDKEAAALCKTTITL